MFKYSIDMFFPQDNETIIFYNYSLFVEVHTSFDRPKINIDRCPMSNSIWTSWFLVYSNSYQSIEKTVNEENELYCITKYACNINIRIWVNEVNGYLRDQNRLTSTKPKIQHNLSSF